MSSTDPFAPHYGSGQTLTSGAASATVSIGSSSKQIRVVNLGANAAYFRVFSAASAADVPSLGVATAADYVVPAGMSSLVTKEEANRFAHISPTGTTLHIIVGNGR